jgi:hypothetical protein
LGALVLTAFSYGAEKKAEAPKKPQFTAIDEENAGPDFKVQGEYVGEVTGADGKKTKLGAQIVACFNGTFHSEFFPGGLPGDGWDGTPKLEKAKAKQGNIPADSKTEGDKTVIEGVYKATIAGDTMTGETDKGEKFSLKKVLRVSPTMGLKPPDGAVILFDGSNSNEWNKKDHLDSRKLLKCGGLTVRKFQDYTLHVEFILPFKPESRSQERGNSGVYMQNRYECQVLDSFGLAGDNNECGGFYTLAAPKVNMCFPPLSWQTYDFEFEAAKYEADGKTKTKNAVCTVKHNGVVIHDKYELKKSTGGGIPETSAPGPIQFQDHGNPVFYRNVWILEKK